MIDWLLKHPALIFVIIMAVSALLKKLKPAAEESSMPQSHPQPHDDTEDAERTRHLQEEIRRKIAERRGQVSPPPVPSQEPEPLFPVPGWIEPAEERSPYKVEEPVARVETAPAVDPMLARQRELAEQLAALKAAQHVAENRVSWQVSKPAETEVEAVAVRADDDVHDLRELRNARSLRKAIILREVLGPPVALR